MLQTNVAPGVHRIEDAHTSWYLIEDEGRLTVVDAGVPRSWNSLREALRELGHRASDIAAVVLTRVHFDHLGFAERARSHYLASQPRVLPYVMGFARTRALFPPPLRSVRRYAHGVLPVPGSPRVVFTPGHTLGHCALHFPDRDVVIAGDAVVTLDPYTGRTGPRIIARAATADSERDLRSLDAVAAPAAGIVLVGPRRIVDRRRSGDRRPSPRRRRRMI